MDELLVKITVLNYLKTYIDWVDNRDTIKYKYTHFQGLCENLHYYLPAPNESSLFCNTLRKLREMFKASGLDIIYPFGRDEYIQCMDMCTQHLHKPRIDWVRKTIIELEMELAC